VIGLCVAAESGVEATMAMASKSEYRLVRPGVLRFMEMRSSLFQKASSTVKHYEHLIR
jgi:hypothetical protein